MTHSLNFCLTFESSLTNVITALSRRLSLGLSTDYVLSPEAIPHVSVLKLNAAPEKSAEVWSKLLPSLPSRLSLRFYGITVIPSKSGDVWLQLNVVRSAELVLLQELASKHVCDYGIRTGVGDLWWPHVTLLHSVDGRLPTNFDLDRALLLAEDVVATPTLGHDMAPGVLTEVLQRPDL